MSWKFMPILVNFPFCEILDSQIKYCAKALKVLVGWLLVLGLKEGLVECATVCVKSWVTLALVHRLNETGGICRKKYNLYIGINVIQIRMSYTIRSI